MKACDDRIWHDELEQKTCIGLYRGQKIFIEEEDIYDNYRL